MIRADILKGETWESIMSLFEVSRAQLKLVHTVNVASQIKVKVKVKLSMRLTKYHAMKAYWESGGIASRILWPRHYMEVISFTLRPLYHQGKSPWYPLDRRLGGPQSRSRRGGEEKNSQPLPGIEP
jgi:hypothetical protein